MPLLNQKQKRFQNTRNISSSKVSREDKNDYESRKAAFTAPVDGTNMPASENILKLQNSLGGELV